MDKKWICILSGLLAAVLLVSLYFFVLKDTNEDEDDDQRDKPSWGELKDESEDESTIIVTNFVGMHYMDEVQSHKDIGNYSVYLEEAYNSDYPEGYIYKQEPAAGMTIKKHGAVKLYISKGSKKETVPTMTPGEKPNDVRRRLELAGFKVQEATESSADVQEGMAIRLDPETGTEAEYGSTVTIFVSSGKPGGEPIDMPNVIGLSKDAALKKLVTAGFDQTKITIKDINSTAPKGTVVGVTPNHTIAQYPDVNIKLQVSNGSSGGQNDLPNDTTTTTRAPVKYAIPNLVGKNFYEVRNEKTNGEFVIANSQQVRNDKPAGTILSQNPAPGTSVDKGATITVVISSGPDDKVTLVDLTGWTEEHARTYLEALGFVVNVDQLYISEQPYGHVEGTDPAAGTFVKKGSTVTLRVSYAE